MSDKPIPEFTETEAWVVRSTLKERYGHDVERQFAETETSLPEGGGMAWCPTLFWPARGANFAVIKTGAKRYRPIFYYHPEIQLGTGVEAYAEIGDATIAVLQVEADHMRKQKIKIDETPAKDDKAAPDKPDLSPFFWGD
jgi:hypothetical protein